MSKFNTLFRGDADEVMTVLDAEECTAGELRVALYNAFGKIADLEKAVAALRNAPAMRMEANEVQRNHVYGGVKS